MNGLPTPYPDELWYSIVARRLRDWGYVNRYAELRHAYRFSPPKINMASPLRPGTFFLDVGMSKSLTTKDLTVRHTLLPYYLAFSSPATRQAALNVIENVDPLVRLSLGSTARKHVPTYLRFCKDCFDVDKLLVGEPYWHRSHQVPGVARCLAHGGVLFESVVPYEPGKLDYWPAHANRCQTRASSRVGEPFGRILTKAMGQVLRMLLCSNEIVNLWIDRQRYASLVTDCGYGTARGRIAATVFEHEFLAFLRSRRADVSRFGPAGWWLASFTRVPGRLTPLQHLLLREFIRHRLSRSRPAVVPIRVVDAHLRMVS